MKFLSVILGVCITFRCTAFESLTIDLVGQIKTKCGISTSLNNLQFEDNGLINTELLINCNSPMRVSLHSLNGGVKHQQNLSVNEYRVNLSILGHSTSRTYTAQSLMTQQTIVVNDLMFNQVMNIQLELLDPFIYAGEYKDTLRIEVSPSAISGGVW